MKQREEQLAEMYVSETVNVLYLCKNLNDKAAKEVIVYIFTVNKSHENLLF